MTESRQEAWYPNKMRFGSAWLVFPLLLHGCSFDRSGLSPTQVDQDRVTVFDAGPDQPGLADAVPRDAPPVGVTPDTQPPDSLTIPDSSPCIYDDFTGPLSSWKVTLQRGDWVWTSPGSARQQKLNYFGAQALVQGSEPMVSALSQPTLPTSSTVVIVALVHAVLSQWATRRVPRAPRVR